MNPGVCLGLSSDYGGFLPYGLARFLVLYGEGVCGHMLWRIIIS